MNIQPWFTRSAFKKPVEKVSLSDDTKRYIASRARCRNISMLNDFKSLSEKNSRHASLLNFRFVCKSFFSVYDCTINLNDQVEMKSYFKSNSRTRNIDVLNQEFLNWLFQYLIWDRNKSSFDTSYSKFSKVDCRLILDDLSMISNVSEFRVLHNLPLFLKRSNYRIISHWKKLLSELHQFPEEHWHVWTDWWEEALLHGSARGRIFPLLR